MKITSTENISLHDAFFGNRSNYDKWAPYFYQEFVKTMSGGRIAGVMTPEMVNIDDAYVNEFIEWLKSKGIIANL